MFPSVSSESASARSSIGFVRSVFRHRLFGMLAPAMAVLVAACSAATTDRERRGSTESNIEDTEEETTAEEGTSAETKSTSAPVAAPMAAVAGGGFSCTAANVAMPTTLPNVKKCINDADKATDNEADCAGWTRVGDFMNTSAELRTAETLGAQLYMIRPDTSTLCLYLYRGDRAVTNNTLNGLHCYNTTTCDVCWWDGESTAGTAPTVADLKHESADGSKCSECHRNGPVLPKESLWTAAEDITRALSRTCAGRGGPTWHQAEAGWGFTTPDATTKVRAPAGCTGASCHTDFASGGEYCQMVGHAFMANGSMRAGAGASFRTKAACETFRTAMGCTDVRPADPAIPFLDCDDTDVAPAAAP